MKLVRGVPLLLERHVHVRGYVSVPLYKHKTNSMVQTIATLIDETLMVMGAHLHVRMTDEEKAYLDAHFELIHIKRENTSSPGARKYATSIIWNPASSGYGFRTKRIERFQHGLSKPKSSSIFPFTWRTPCPLQYQGIGAMQDLEIAQKDLHQLYELSINFNKLARIHLVRSINRK